jgi:hypothetical protein
MTCISRVLLLAVVLGSLACSRPAPPAGELVSAFALRLGDCLNDAVADDDSDSVANLRRLPCEQPHAYEVYLVHALSNASFPGSEAVSELADELCHEAFAGYVGIDYDDSEFDYSMMWPSAGSWRHQRDRDIVCLITSLDEQPLLGSARGVAR